MEGKCRCLEINLLLKRGNIFRELTRMKDSKYFYFFIMREEKSPCFWIVSPCTSGSPAAAAAAEESTHLDPASAFPTVHLWDEFDKSAYFPVLPLIFMHTTLEEMGGKTHSSDRNKCSNLVILKPVIKERQKQIKTFGFRWKHKIISLLLPIFFISTFWSFYWD